MNKLASNFDSRVLNLVPASNVPVAKGIANGKAPLDPDETCDSLFAQFTGMNEEVSYGERYLQELLSVTSYVSLSPAAAPAHTQGPPVAGTQIANLRNADINAAARLIENSDGENYAVENYTVENAGGERHLNESFANELYTNESYSNERYSNQDSSNEYYSNEVYQTGNAEQLDGIPAPENMEQSIWWGHAAPADSRASFAPTPAIQGLTKSDLQSLRTILETSSSEHIAAEPRKFLARKPVEDSAPSIRKKKVEAAREKDPPKIGPTVTEYFIFGAFLIYILLASIGVIKLDGKTLLGPRFGSPASASTNVEEMRQTNLAESHTQIERARDLSKNGNQREAFEAVDQALKLSPTAEGYTQRARMALAAGYGDSAINDYDRSIELKRDASMIYERGLAHMGNKNMKHAAMDFTAVIKSGAVKDTFRVYALRGRAMSEMGRFAEAVRDYKKAIAIAPPESSAEIAGYKNELVKNVARLRVHRSH